MTKVTRVSKGDPFPTDAATVNSILSAAAAHERRGEAIGASREGPAITNNLLVKIQNRSGSDLNLYDILVHGVTVPEPTDNLAEFTYGQITLVGFTPDISTSDWGRFVVLAEPIKNNAIGLATIMGITRVRLTGAPSRVKDYYLHADIIDGETGHLTYSDNGTAAVLRITNQASSVQLGIVMLGHHYLPREDPGVASAWIHTSADRYRWG